MSGFLAWLSGLNVSGKVIMALVAGGLLAIGIATGFHLVNSALATAEQKGAVAERAETQGKVIENVRKAQDAAEAVRRDGVPLADCLRDSRTPENCR